MRGLPIRQIEQDFVHIAPAPSFRRIVAFDDGMSGGVEMLGGMFVGRIIAAADMAATAADPQMQPYASALQALLATERARRDVTNAGDVRAALCHAQPLSLASDFNRNLLMRYSAGFSASPRNPCSAATTCAPSPIAPPTRLTDPERTSPTANTPGTEVSSGAIAPRVTMKPVLSTSTPHPASQAAAGSAPMKRKTLRIVPSVSTPVPRSRHRTRSTPSGPPCKAAISVCVISSMFGAAAIRSIRYRDMLSASPGARTIMRTLAAWSER